MKILISLIFVFGVILSGYANPGMQLKDGKEISVSGQINLDDHYSIFFIWKGEPGKSDELSLNKDGSFHWKTRINNPEFFLVTIQSKARDRQLATTFPLFLVPGQNVHLNLNYSDSSLLSYVSGNLDNNNKALFSYARFSTLESIRFFKHTTSASNLPKEAMSYINTSDSLIAGLKVKNKMVKQYLVIWSFNDYQEAVERYSSNRGSNNTKNAIADLPRSPKEIYDNSVTPLLQSSYRFINQYLNSLPGTEDRRNLASLKEKIGLMDSVFKNPKVKEWIIESGLQRAILQYTVKDSLDFELQQKLFKEIADRIVDIDKRNALIHAFNNLRYTKEGSPMPDVTFKDSSGKAVAFKSFEGKYIYMDLWASWCIPCIAEVPNLKKLEEEYKNKNIVFISLSLDEDKDAWKNKMKDLKLDGIQLELGDSDYDKMMNIQGIPHFILYDAAGKLLRYDAPRPGTDAIRNIFDSI